MIVAGEVTLTLCATQIQAVVRQATVPSLTEAFIGAEPESVASTLRPLLEDSAYCRSVVRALIILASFPPDGSERELTAVAADVELSAGTTHRYLQTLTAAGLLQRDSQSRRYRRPAASRPE